MTNFIQPVWTLKASDGATQNPQYQRIPRTQASQNQKAITKGNDPRADNTKSKPYDMANMRIQETFFTNPSGAIIAAAALIGFAVVIARR
jgi:hypothetical protein